jgi:hypothetical protein
MGDGFIAADGLGAAHLSTPRAEELDRQALRMATERLGEAECQSAEEVWGDPSLIDPCLRSPMTLSGGRRRSTGRKRPTG